MDITSNRGKAPILQELPSRLLGQTSALVARIAADALASAGSHRHQFAVLATLDAFGPCSQADLCRRTDLDRSDMNNLIAILLEQGFVNREVDERNRRQNLVSISKTGQKAFQHLKSLLEQAQIVVLEPLAASEKAQLIDFLRRIHDHLAPA